MHNTFDLIREWLGKHLGFTSYFASKVAGSIKPIATEELEKTKAPASSVSNPPYYMGESMSAGTFIQKLLAVRAAEKMRITTYQNQLAAFQNSLVALLELRDLWSRSPQPNLTNFSAKSVG